MEDNSNFAVSMVHELCPICCTETNQQIVMNSKLTKKHADNVREMHHKAIGFSEPCGECQKNLDNGFIALISFDPSKTITDANTVRLEDLYRTKLVFLKKDKAEEIFGSSENRPFYLLEDAVFEKLGIPTTKKELEENG